MFGDGVVQGFHAEAGVHCVLQPPAQYLARCPIHDCDQIQEAIANGHKVISAHAMTTDYGSVTAQIGRDLRIVRNRNGSVTRRHLAIRALRKAIQTISGAKEKSSSLAAAIC